MFNNAVDVLIEESEQQSSNAQSRQTFNLRLFIVVNEGSSSCILIVILGIENYEQMFSFELTYQLLDSTFC